MSAITNALKAILDWIYSIVANYGWSIVIFTILIKLVLMPLDVKNRKGMRKMAKIQPEINKLQKKYANDKQKLQQKQSELMKKERYSPLSGCLPLLIQMPILFAMFGAMRALANEQIVSQVFSFLSGKAPTYEGWLWVKNIWMADSLFASVAPDPNAIRVITADVWQKIYQTLSPEQIQVMVQHVAKAVPEFAASGFDFSSAEALKALLPSMMVTMQAMPEYLAQIAPMSGWSNINFILFNITIFQQYNGYLILPALAGLSQVLMTKLTPGATGAAPAVTTGQEGSPAGQAAGMGGFMKYFFPLFSVFITLTSNAGFALYWVVSNLIATALNVVITRHYDNKDKLEGEAKGAITLS
ncbi:MAG: YidC/Oxa1 family membrane protein insertase [Christensenellales bacterium]